MQCVSGQRTCLQLPMYMHKYDGRMIHVSARGIKWYELWVRGGPVRVTL